MRPATRSATVPRSELSQQTAAGGASGAGVGSDESLVPTVSPRTRSTVRGLMRAGRPRTLFLGLVGVLLFFGCWQLIATTGVISRGTLPTAGATLREVGSLLTNSVFLRNVVDTLWASALGFGLAFVIAVPAGLVLGMSDRAYRLTSTVVELLRPLPPIAFVPLMVLVLGQGLHMKVVIVMLGCIWPLLTNTIHGVHATNRTAEPVNLNEARFGAYY